jgi:hypothetical protein
MELGVSPINTSGTTMQFLTGANLFEVDFLLNEDRALSSGAQKCEHPLVSIAPLFFPPLHRHLYALGGAHWVLSHHHDLLHALLPGVG